MTSDSDAILNLKRAPEGEPDAHSRLVSRHLKIMFRGSVAMLAGSAVQQALRYGRGILIARGLGAGLLGSFGLLMQVQRLTGAFASAGLPQANLKFVAECLGREDSNGVRATTAVTVGLSAALGAVLCAALWALAPAVANNVYGRPGLTFPLRVAAIAMVLAAISTAIASVSQAARRILPIVLISRIGVPLVFLAAVSVVVFVHGSAAALMTAYVIAVGLGLLVWVVVLARWLPRPTPDKARSISLRRVLGFSLSMLLLGISWLAIDAADVVILGRYVSAEELGIYLAASRTARLISFPFSGLNALYGPTVSELFAQNDLRALREVYAAATSWATGAGFGILGCVVVAPHLILGLFGRDFASGGNVLMVLAIGEFVRAATGSGTWTLTMTGGHYASSSIGWLGAAAMVGGLLVMAPLWGTLGAAVCTSAVKGAATIAFMVAAYRRLRLHPYSLAYLAQGLATVALMLLVRTALHGWAALAVFAAAFVVLARISWFRGGVLPMRAPRPEQARGSDK